MILHRMDSSNDQFHEYLKMLQGHVMVTFLGVDFNSYSDKPKVNQCLDQSTYHRRWQDLVLEKIIDKFEIIYAKAYFFKETYL